jgi:ribosomal protein S12 methylthiotransferase accessory factor
MDMEITFPGGKRVEASLAGQVIKTDQSPQSGGGGTAPEPYALFLASMGTCAGIYVLGFCEGRGLPTEGLKITQRMDWDAVTRRLTDVHFDIRLPDGFPEKYKGAVARAADQCAVKKAILDPPSFHIGIAGE